MKCKLGMLLLFSSGLAAAGAGPFGISAALNAEPGGPVQLVVRVVIPDGHLLYADDFKVEAAGGGVLAPSALPVPQKKKDAFSGVEKLFYDQSFSAVYQVVDPAGAQLAFKVSYQGCDKTTCFLPEEKEFKLPFAGAAGGVGRGGATSSAPDADPEIARLLTQLNNDYSVAAARPGYMDAEGFMQFLDASRGRSSAPLSVQGIWQSGKVWLSLLVMLLGGLALNLTPCVLPLIPVNLAIIGAGARAVSPGRGFLLGGLYGLGIVLAYGGLGLAAALTGAQFGAINSSPWFNLGVAALFLVLGLALFDLISVDLSRFQGRLKLEGKGVFFVIIPGAVSALLAGACVAPVVIAVLLLSSDLYLKGQVVGLFLPFVLGLGMALPWPFAGAGLSFLPKPGKWMVNIKHVFAGIIILAALYYGYAGARMLHGSSRASGEAEAGSGAGAWTPFTGTMPAAPGKPVLVYFWAQWCKSCHAMNRSTFSDPRVVEKMSDFACLKFEAANPRDPRTAAIMRAFGVAGLPTFVVLIPKNMQPAAQAP